jgi:hypothetical protein
MAQVSLMLRQISFSRNFINSIQVFAENMEEQVWGYRYEEDWLRPMAVRCGMMKIIIEVRPSNLQYRDTGNVNGK